MDLNRLFEAVEQVHSAANWRAVFGEPQTVDGATVIPLAEVKYGFGLGFGQADEADAGETAPEAEPAAGGGAGAGGGLTARPLGVLEVTPKGVRPVPFVDAGRLAVSGMALAAWLGFWTMRALGRVLGSPTE
jgi:uncharacterized spore protein YtfJ